MKRDLLCLHLFRMGFDSIKGALVNYCSQEAPATSDLAIDLNTSLAHWLVSPSDKTGHPQIRPITNQAAEVRAGPAFTAGGLGVTPTGAVWLRVGVWARFGIFHQAMSMWACWMWSSTEAIVNGAPQKHCDRPFVIWVGSGIPVSRIRYFHAVKARCRRFSAKSDSVQRGR
jgi:hypothetical protein